MQLLVRPGFVEVVRGPKENGHRPSVDALFRSASLAYGPRVVGVVLSGYQDCGTAGLMSIKARGGVAVVQSPETASVPDMPQSCLDRVDVDHVIHPLELPGLLTRLASAETGPVLAPALEVEQLEGTAPGSPAPIVCPLCQGALTESHPGTFTHFRCHVGHTFSLECLIEEQGEEMERTLWGAVRALEEGARLSRRLSESHGGDLSSRFAEKAKTQMEQADLIREMLLYGRRLDGQDAAAAP
jgi:two-component system chemotaxis response regulator CheB